MSRLEANGIEWNDNGSYCVDSGAARHQHCCHLTYDMVQRGTNLEMFGRHLMLPSAQ
jgi:hypothetical protein